MSEPTPKSSNLLQAQIAAFAAEGIEHYQDKEHIYNNLGNLALGKAGDITRVTDSAEYHKDKDGKNNLRVPEGTEMKVATAAEFTDFLRSVGGSRHEAIHGRAEILTAYSRFEPVITKLRAELADPATRRAHPNYLGSGSNSTVFSITEGDKSYAVRVPNGGDIKPSVIDSHLAGAVLGRGIPHLEQIVAGSYLDGVTVAEVMPGKEVGHLALAEIKGIRNDQLEELVDTLLAVSEQGIEIDPKPSNIFYDPKDGYGIVDYQSSKVAGKSSADQDLGKIVGWMATAIDNAGFYGKPYKPVKSTEDYSRDLEFKKVNLEVLERYRTIVEAKLSGEEQRTALAEIDTHIASGKEAVDNYSNHQWVAERIEQEQEWSRQRKEQATKRKTAADGRFMLDLDIL